jgi:hypothetical protein
MGVAKSVGKRGDTVWNYSMGSPYWGPFSLLVSTANQGQKKRGKLARLTQSSILERICAFGEGSK